MNLCHIVPSLEERHGGPSKSVRALANALAGQDSRVTLLTTHEAGQALESPIIGNDSADIRVFPRVTPRFLCRSPEMRRDLRAGGYDVIHHHALWLLTLRYAQEAAAAGDRPLVLSPRGMMNRWAWQHHRSRKRLASLLVHPGAFRQAAGWHATSEEEAADIRALGFSQPVCVSPNGVSLPGDDELATARAAWQRLCPAVQSRPVALFYSRFHRKKRVRELIDLWRAASRGDWLLLIVGTAEDYSAAELSAEVSAAGAGDDIVVCDGAGLPPPYAVASLFLLPSHSENFGLVIAEALAAGVPALVTDTTPWSRLAAHTAGWCEPWDNYPAALTAALAVAPTELQAMGRRGRDWMAQDFSWAGAAHRLQQFYQHLCDDRA